MRISQTFAARERMLLMQKVTSDSSGPLHDISRVQHSGLKMYCTQLDSNLQVLARNVEDLVIAAVSRTLSTYVFEKYVRLLLKTTMKMHLFDTVYRIQFVGPVQISEIVVATWFSLTTKYYHRQL